MKLFGVECSSAQRAELLEAKQISVIMRTIVGHTHAHAQEDNCFERYSKGTCKSAHSVALQKGR